MGRQLSFYRSPFSHALASKFTNAPQYKLWIFLLDEKLAALQTRRFVLQIDACS